MLLSRTFEGSSNAASALIDACDKERESVETIATSHRLFSSSHIHGMDSGDEEDHCCDEDDDVGFGCFFVQ